MSRSQSSAQNRRKSVSDALRPSIGGKMMRSAVPRQHRSVSLHWYGITTGVIREHTWIFFLWRRGALSRAAPPPPSHSSGMWVQLAPNSGLQSYAPVRVLACPLLHRYPSHCAAESRHTATHCPSVHIYVCSWRCLAIFSAKNRRSITMCLL